MKSANQMVLTETFVNVYDIRLVEQTSYSCCGFKKHTFLLFCSGGFGSFCDDSKRVVLKYSRSVPAARF